MSTTASPAELQSTPAPVKVGLVPLLIAALSSTFIALTVAGGAAYWAVRSSKLTSAAAQTANKAETPVASHLVALEPMVVNLADTGGHSYLRAAVTLRMQDEPAAKKEKSEADKSAKTDTADLRDTILAVLSVETPEALLSADGREALKSRLKQKLSQRNSDARVLDVYFTDFLVQRG